MTRIKRTGLPAPPRPQKKRGVVSGLSVSSGQRLQNAVTSVNPAHGNPLWICFTYPNDWPGSPELWKRHLHNLRRSLKDVPEDPFIGAIWRLEAQRRGAPHYHILLWHRMPEMEKAERLEEFQGWLRKVWYRIVGSGDPEHLKHGVEATQITTKEAQRKVMIYLGKYLGKDSVHPKSQVYKYPVGRHWGVWNKAELLVEPETSYVSQDQYKTLRRIFRSKRKSDERERRKKTGTKPQKLKGKENFNKSKNRELLMPGAKCYIEAKEIEKILAHVDPPPF